MSGGVVCKCPKAERDWQVIQLRQNCSAFNGYHSTVSAYSEVRCFECFSRWRTTARYVDKLPLANYYWLEDRQVPTSKKVDPNLGSSPASLPKDTP